MYLSCARCNAISAVRAGQRRVTVLTNVASPVERPIHPQPLAVERGVVALALLCFARAGAGQPRFAPINGVPMNNAALGRFIDGGKERSYIRRLRFRLAGAFAQSPNTRENATIFE